MPIPKLASPLQQQACRQDPQLALHSSESCINPIRPHSSLISNHRSLIPYPTSYIDSAHPRIFNSLIPIRNPVSCIQNSIGNPPPTKGGSLPPIGLPSPGIAGLPSGIKHAGNTRNLPCVAQPDRILNFSLPGIASRLSSSKSDLLYPPKPWPRRKSG